MGESSNSIEVIPLCQIMLQHDRVDRIEIDNIDRIDRIDSIDRIDRASNKKHQF